MLYSKNSASLPPPQKFSFSTQDTPTTMFNPTPTIQAILTDEISVHDQLRIFEAMSPSVRREIVNKTAGLEASLLMTFKEHVALVDSIVKYIAEGEKTDYDISLKDALAISVRLTQIMVKDLPKLYNIERIQKQEQALIKVMRNHLTREQQDAFLEELSAAMVG